MEKLNTYINHTDYSGIKNFFLEKGKKQIFRRKDYFVQQNSISLYAGYIEQGIFHYTRVDSSGKEHVVGYSFENEFICDYSSFIKKTESLVSICALTECTVYLISLNEYLEYANTFQNGVHFGFQVANELFEMYYKKTIGSILRKSRTTLYQPDETMSGVERKSSIERNCLFSWN